MEGLAKLVIIVGLIHAWFAFSAATAISFPSIPECNDLGDVFTGCTGSLAVLSSLVLGTMVAAPTILNALIVFVQAAYAVFLVIEVMLKLL